MLISPMGFFAASGASAAGAYELISTTVLTSTATSITFSSVPANYQHLQIRMTARLTSGSGFQPLRVRFNGAATATYLMHYLEGNSSVVSSGGFTTITDGIRQQGMMAGSATAAGVYGAAVIDILNYRANANKTIRTLAGGINTADTTARITLNSGAWVDSNAITEIRIAENAGATMAIGSRFSLYGIKGA